MLTELPRCRRSLMRPAEGAPVSPAPSTREAPSHTWSPSSMRGGGRVRARCAKPWLVTKRKAGEPAPGVTMQCGWVSGTDRCCPPGSRRDPAMHEVGLLPAHVNPETVLLVQGPCEPTSKGPVCVSCRPQGLLDGKSWEGGWPGRAVGRVRGRRSGISELLWAQLPDLSEPERSHASGQPAVPLLPPRCARGVRGTDTHSVCDGTSPWSGASLKSWGFVPLLCLPCRCQPTSM